MLEQRDQTRLADCPANAAAHSEQPPSKIRRILVEAFPTRSACGTRGLGYQGLTGLENDAPEHQDKCAVEPNSPTELGPDSCSWQYFMIAAPGAMHAPWRMHWWPPGFDTTGACHDLHDHHLLTWVDASASAP
eukprot:366353-Chlamydomonas_euryale.AAC.2